MDNKILAKVKEHLLFNSEIYKNRQKLIEEYVENVKRITYEVLGENGKRVIERYPNAIQYYTDITIPGYYRHLGQQGYCNISADCVKEVNLPIVIHGLNSAYSNNLNCGSDEDKEWYRKMREDLEKNGKEIGYLCENLDSTLKTGTTLIQLQNYFPEAYKLYIKFKNNEERKTN